MKNWKKNIAMWQIKKTLYISVPFTWMLPEAYEKAYHHKGPVKAGGPAVKLMPEYLERVAECNGDPIVSPLAFHNPLATFTTRGCPNKCSFCAVPQIEGPFRELKDWPIRPIICDNNLLDASIKHFDRVIDRLKGMPYVDFNQGLDARKFTPHHASRLAELKAVKVRFAFDSLHVESKVADAFTLAKEHGLKDFGCYVLIGYKDTPEDARYRLEKVREWSILPNPMRYQPLDAMEKNCFVNKCWTAKELKRMTRYYSRLSWLEHIPYEEFQEDKQEKLFLTRLKSLTSPVRPVIVGRTPKD